MRKAARIRGLYFVTAEDLELGRSHDALAKQALEGGARVVQYREKRRPARYVETALAVRDACRAAGALFVVNDDAQLAVDLDADGLHLGQSDLGQLDRGALPESMVLGISASSLAQAEHACSLGADYLGVGPVFATPSKHDAAPPMGIDGLAAVRQAFDVPIAAIGGVSHENAADVLAAGADAICVISAISRAEDPRAAARLLADLAEVSQPTTFGGVS
ncbi:MAG: thiamine phosphate synthase [Coriobacteriales bacterium]|nr:thiamine phosphate synthase [Coriobacteriales bacterium]